jgi:FkbM family methyltransferase
MYIRAHNLKKTIVKYARATNRRMTWAWRILRSDYPKLLFDMALEEKFAQGPFPTPRYLGTNEGNDLFEVCDIHIHWPSSFRTGGIRWVYREVFAAPRVNPHAYEYGNVRMTAGSWVIDAGASEGFFVHYALMRGCNVLAIEPVSSLVRALQLTFRAEIADGRVRIVEGAVGGAAGTAQLSRGEHDDFSSHLDTTGETSVRVFTLDELVDSQNIRDLSFVKMDIEGAELYALGGAHSVLRDLKPNLSIAVYHSESTALILTDQLRWIAPNYRIRFRGVWLRNADPPRPYILMASLT